MRHDILTAVLALLAAAALGALFGVHLGDASCQAVGEAHRVVEITYLEALKSARAEASELREEVEDLHKTVNLWRTIARRGDLPLELEHDKLLKEQHRLIETGCAVPGGVFPSGMEDEPVP